MKKTFYISQLVLTERIPFCLFVFVAESCFHMKRIIQFNIVTSTCCFPCRSPIHGYILYPAGPAAVSSDSYVSGYLLAGLQHAGDHHWEGRPAHVTHVVFKSSVAFFRRCLFRHSCNTVQCIQTDWQCSEWLACNTFSRPHCVYDMSAKTCHQMNPSLQLHRQCPLTTCR